MFITAVIAFCILATAIGTYYIAEDIGYKKGFMNGFNKGYDHSNEIFLTKKKVEIGQLISVTKPY